MNNQPVKMLGINDMIQHRWSYFFWTTVYLVLVGAGLWFGKLERIHFFKQSLFYVWMGACGVLFAFGFFTWVYYLYLIIKNYGRMHS